MDSTTIGRVADCTQDTASGRSALFNSLVNFLLRANERT
jgi:hypothetical protein